MINQKGLALASRFAFPPNFFSLCGPDRQKDLAWYTQTQKTDKGALEILSQFSTLYPYLVLIASENKIADPFDPRVVEAYFIGNSLLNNIPYSIFGKHLSENLDLKKKIKHNEFEIIMKKVIKGGLPYHSFHVCNIYKRTGYLNIPHTIESMDACIINWGKIMSIFKDKIQITTKPLKLIDNKLKFGKEITRSIQIEGEKDVLVNELKKGDFVSYHWGFFCKKMSSVQITNLKYFTNISLRFANL